MPWEFPHPRRLRRIHALQVSLLIVAWAVLSAWLAALPVVLVEPDDEMFYAAMKLFAKDEILWRRSEIAEAMRPLEFVRGPGFGSPLPPFFQPSGTGTDLLGIEKSPGHPAALALAYKLGLVDWLGPLLALVSCLFLYALVRRLGEERGWAATAAALLLLLNANSIAGQWRIYMSDYSSAIQVAMGMGLYLWARESGRLWLFALSGLWLAIAVAFRYTNVLAIGAVALYEVIRAFEGGWRGALMRFLKHKGHWAAAAGAIVGLLPLCWYLLELTGSPLRTGYADRFDRQYSSYFSLSLHDPRALFSLGHVPKVFFSGFPMFLLGFPLLPLAVAGLGAMPRRRSRPALFLGLWAAAFWAPHLCYGWVRADAFVFMCRKFLPSLGALCILAAAALARLAGGDWAAEGGVEDSEESAASGPSARGARLAAVATFLVLILFGLSLGIDFCVRYGVYGQGRVARESWGRWTHRQDAPGPGRPQGVGPQGGAFAPGLPPMPPDRVRGDIEMGRPPFAPDLRLPSRAGEPRRPPQAPPVNADEAETFQRFAQSVRPWLDAPEVEIFLTPGLPEEVVHVAERLRDALTAKGRLAVTLPDDAPAKHRMAILVGDYERNARALEILVDSPDLSRVELPGGGSVKCARSEQASGLFVVGSAEEMRRALDLLARLAAQAPDR